MGACSIEESLARSGLEKGTQKPLNPSSSASEHLRKTRTIESSASKCWVTGGYWGLLGHRKRRPSETGDYRLAQTIRGQGEVQRYI